VIVARPEHPSTLATGRPGDYQLAEQPTVAAQGDPAELHRLCIFQLDLS
jgi:hypothetical protein